MPLPASSPPPVPRRPRSFPDAGLSPYRIGPYEILARIGVGGMGTAYLASILGPHQFRKLCVVKRLHKRLAKSDSARERFSYEASLAARFNHYHVVQTFDIGEDRGVPYLAMEFLEGQSLRTLWSVAHHGAVVPDPGLWVRLVCDALSGLEHVHELRDFDGSPLGLVHRDVSPHNIFVTYSGRVCLLDFGMLKIRRDEGAVSCRTLAGKPRYMAPEYVRTGMVDARTDLFSMGVVLWECLTGQTMPLADLDVGRVSAPRPRLRSVVPKLSPHLDRLVAKALDVEPEGRFQSAREMREALEEYLAASTTEPPRDELEAMMDAYFEEEQDELNALVSLRMRTVEGALVASAAQQASRVVRMPPSRASNWSSLSHVRVLPLSPHEGPASSR